MGADGSVLAFRSLACALVSPPKTQRGSNKDRCSRSRRHTIALGVCLLGGSGRQARANDVFCGWCWWTVWESWCSKAKRGWRGQDRAVG
ncbi:hypothetical protein LX36DRAFT_458011 [Colletotrichum falcatum]|nr:hypothetical protein LX36DRAFT_458011 [Colletotrichum falcatum]